MKYIINLIARVIYGYGVHGAQMASFHGGYEASVPEYLQK